MPKRQHPVKIELFHRLQQTDGFEPARHRAEADGFEQGGRAEVQERQLAEAGVQAPVPDRQFRIDVGGLGEPLDRVALAADLVGKSESTMRSWCEHHGLGRRIGGGFWMVSKVALAMFLDGDMKALRAYHGGERTDPCVIAYFERLGLG